MPAGYVQVLGPRIANLPVDDVGLRSFLGFGPLRFSAPSGEQHGHRSCFGFGPLRFCVPTSATSAGQSGGIGFNQSERRRPLDALLAARRLREQREEEELVAMLLMLDDLE